MAQLDLDEHVTVTLTREQMAVAVIAISMGADLLPVKKLEPIAERLCSIFQRTGAPVGVVTRVLEKYRR